MSNSEEHQRSGETILTDAPIQNGMVPIWSSNNRTLKARLSPAPGEGLAWVSIKSVADHRHESWAHEKLEHPDLRLYPFETSTGRGGSKFSKNKMMLMLKLHDLLLWFYNRVDQLMKTDAIQQREGLVGKIMEEICIMIKQHLRDDHEQDQDQEPDRFELKTVRRGIALLRIMEFIGDDQNKNNDDKFCKLFCDWSSDCSELLFNTDEELAVLLNRADVALDDEVWAFLYRLVGRGMTKLSAQCLRYMFMDKHGYVSTTITEELRECVDYSIELLNFYHESQQTQQTEELDLEQWKHACLRASVICSRLPADPIQKRLSMLLKILCADLASIKVATVNWYETVACLLRYRNSSKDRLSDYCDAALQIWGINEANIAPWDMVIVELIKGRTLSAILRMSEVDMCVTTIVAEIAYRSDRFDRFVGSNLDVQSIMEWFHLSHARECISQQDFQLSKSTFDICYLQMRELYQQLVYLKKNESEEVYNVEAEPITAYVLKLKQLLGESLTMIPLETKEELTWGIDFSSKLRLDSSKIPSLLVQKYASTQIAIGAYKEALLVLDRVKDYQRLKVICGKMFEKLLLSLDVSSDKTIDELVKRPPTYFSRDLKQLISPFAVLYDAVKCLGTNRRQAVIKFIHLLTADCVPPQYTALLIAVAIPLFDVEKGQVVTERDATIFISAIDDWQRNTHKKIVHEGSALLEHSLMRKNTRKLGLEDWRNYFVITDSTDKVLATARSLLARALSVAMLARG